MWGTLLRAALRPLMATWYASAVRRNASIPRPTDAPTGEAPGPERIQVLIAGGNGPPVGWGVRSHGLALPGQLARELSSRTGRGVTVDVVADPSITLATMPSALASRNLSHYDVIVVMPGVREAITLTPPLVWKRRLASLFGDLMIRSAPETRIVFVGSQPIRSIPAFNSPIASLALRHRALLNALSADLCARTPGATYVTLPAPDRPDLGRYRSPGDYMFWARVLAPHLVGA